MGECKDLLFDEQSRKSSRELTSCIVDIRHMLFSASVSIPGVVIVVWVLDEARVVVSGEVAARFVVVVGCDMAA